MSQTFFVGFVKHLTYIPGTYPHNNRCRRQRRVGRRRGKSALHKGTQQNVRTQRARP